MLRSPLRPLLRKPMQGLIGPGPYTLVKKAIGILRSYGADAHIYLPGVGTVNGITAGNYLDSAGVTAASVDNPVGLSLDALQAMTLGSNLAVNGTFSADANWNKDANWTIAGGVATSNGGAGFLQAIAKPLTNGKTYLMAFTIKRYVSGSMYYPLSGSGRVLAPTAVGTYAWIHQAVTTDLYLYSNSFNGDIDDVIAQEIPGIHATQGTTANKPILRRGAVNLLLQSQDFSAWSGAGVTKAPNTITAPDGTTTACRLTFTGASQDFAVQVPATAGDKTGHLWIKGIASQTIQTQHGGAGPKTTLSGEWQKVTYASTVTILANFDINTYGGSTARIVDIWHPQLEVGTTASDYSPTTTAAASNPSAGKYSWQFDGSNDSLSLSAPLFQMSDDHCVIAGANCTTSSAATIAQIAGKNTGAQAAGLSYAAGGFITATWFDDAALHKSIADPASRLNSNNVATAIKIGNNKRLRVNGVQIGAVESTAMGVATFNTGSIGCATWANNYMQGSIYPVIAIKGTVSDSDLLTLERFVGQLSGVLSI